MTGSSYGIEIDFDYATIKYSQSPSFKSLDLTALIEGFYNSTSNKMIKDTVRVYLRNVNSPFLTIDSSKSVLDSTGKGMFSFYNAANGIPYYIVVKHRNSIETWSASGQSFSSNTLSYDFTTSSSKAYGNNMVQKGSRFCIYSGDVNQDGSVNGLDLGIADNDAFNFVTGYVKSDVNGDNVTNALDLSTTDNNAFNFVSKITPP